MTFRSLAGALRQREEMILLSHRTPQFPPTLTPPRTQSQPSIKDSLTLLALLPLTDLPLLLLAQLHQRLAALPLAPLILGLNESMDGSMIQHPFLEIILPLLIRLGPIVAIEFGVPLAARAGDACEVSFTLNELLIAVAALDPAVVGCGEEGAGKVIVAWCADWAALFVFVFLLVVGFGFFDLDAADGRC